MADNDNQTGGQGKLRRGLSNVARTVFGASAGFFCAAGLIMYAFNPDTAALNAGALIALGLVLGAVSANADLIAGSGAKR